MTYCTIFKGSFLFRFNNGEGWEPFYKGASFYTWMQWKVFAKPNVISRIITIYRYNGMVVPQKPNEEFKHDNAFSFHSAGMANPVNKESRINENNNILCENTPKTNNTICKAEDLERPDEWERIKRGLEP